MEIIFGLFIIAIGAFCQSSCYVPINKVKSWSWESYWLTQSVFAFLLLPLLGAILAFATSGNNPLELFLQNPKATWMTIFYGVLWGIGGLTFGLSMRYLGVALGQSITLGLCAGLGTLLAPVFTGHTEKLTLPVIVGVVVTLVGIAIIGAAGSMKSVTLSDEEKRETVKDFNFSKGIIVALLSGFMSACFNFGLEQGAEIKFAGISPMLSSLPATFLVTLGGFFTNAIYCLHQHSKNKTFGDYHIDRPTIKNNVIFCLLAGALWYSQFFGLSLGKGFLTESPTLLTFSFCILMALNVVFSNVWGIILREWKGCSRTTITVLIIGILILVISCFLPQLI